MVSLKNGFTAWRQSQKEDFLSVIYQCLAQHAPATPLNWTSYVYHPLIENLLMNSSYASLQL